MHKIYSLNPEQLKILNSKGTNYTKIFKYAKAMERGVVFPPVKIWYDNNNNVWEYNDGRNRVMAAKLANCKLLVKTKSRCKFLDKEP